jgi:hypothetical protein
MALDKVLVGLLVATAVLALTSFLSVILDDFKLPAWLRGRRRWYALVVVILATAGLGLYTDVMDTGAGLEVSDRSAPPGTSVQATGRGYQPREDIRLSVSLTQGGRSRTVSLGETATTDSSGRFQLTFGVPILAVGAERLSAVGDASGHTEITGFSVPALAPTIELSPSTGRAGTEVEVTGDEFFPGETVELRAGRRPRSIVAADDRGAFAATVRLPGDKGTESGTQITVTAKGRATVGPFGAATSTYIVTTPTPPPKPTRSVTPGPSEPEGTSQPVGPGNETAVPEPESGGTEPQEPPSDPSMPRSYLGTWTGEDTSDASLTTSMQLTLTGGEVGTVVGQSDYAAALTYGGTLRLVEVGSNYVIVRETLSAPSTGVTDILLGARSRNTLDYQSDRRAVVLSRN